MSLLEMSMLGECIRLWPAGVLHILYVILLGMNDLPITHAQPGARWVRVRVSQDCA